MILYETANYSGIRTSIIEPRAKKNLAKVIRSVTEAGFPGRGRGLIFSRIWDILIWTIFWRKKMRTTIR